MALTTIDSRVALIVIDLQKGVVGLPVAHPMAEIVGRARQLADAFRRRGLPVVLVNVTGAPPGRTERGFRGELPEGFAEFVPELRPQPGDHTVTKRTAGAFTKTDLEAWLKAKAVTQVVIAGVATSMGVEATARQAHELGFHVTLAVDAMTDQDAGLHDVIIARVFPRMSETGTTSEIIKLLAVNLE
jgi:nicotinamidase-related amidase